MAQLWARWQDESKYEDFNEYVAAFGKWTTEKFPNAKVISGAKRPFQFVLQIEGMPYKVAFTCNAKATSWKPA